MKKNLKTKVVLTGGPAGLGLLLSLGLVPPALAQRAPALSEPAAGKRPAVRHSALPLRAIHSDVGAANAQKRRIRYTMRSLNLISHGDEPQCP